ncbi:MAG: ZIP family metal transporter [Bacteroidetes bacterium]|nr:ZIP family metal transporter [Bacteroidota bacterium]
MLYAIISVLIVSLISLIGVFAFAIKEEKLKKTLLLLVSFSAGALLGGAFFHLLPEATEEIGFEKVALYTLIGLILFFILEKFIRWRHCHVVTSENHPHPIGYMNLVGDAVHNFIDGTIIAAAYIISLPLGLTTTLAVILHEVPQEIGDFGILLHAGFKKKRALLFNFLSALFALIGCLATFALDQFIENLSLFLIPFAAGGFIYIAGADLIPELKKERGFNKSFFQLIALLLGIVLMFSLKFLE